jgi:hypothetical protein
MKSLRQIEREYNRMLINMGKEPPRKDKINIYTCANGHTIKTIDIDKGTTPFLLNCGVCGAEAKSSFYKDDNPELNISHEFYRPDLFYVMKKLRKHPELLEHVLKGGLLCRKVIKPTPEIITPG